MKLRDYQENCVRAVRTEFEAGVQRQLLVLATGAGKTVIFSHLPKLLNKRTLILAHREELIKQAADKVLRINSGKVIGIEQAEEYAPRFADIVIASVPTISRNKLRRLERLGQFDLIITDEAHHANADTYRRIYEHQGFPCGPGAEARHGKLHVGVTATPKRSDGIGLEQIYDKVVFQKNIREMIEEGYLVDIVSDQIVTGTSLDGIHSKMGDFNEGELGERVNNDERNSLIVKGYIDHSYGKKAIVFCVDVEHTQNITDLFCRNGIAAEMVVGTTTSDNRKAILQRFKTGQTKVLCGCMVFTEGFDEPSTEVVIMARPTKSQLIYIQQLGRGLRPNVDLTGYNTPEERIRVIQESRKPSLHLLDVVDNCTKHSPIMLATLFGIPKKVKLRKKGIVQAVKEIEAAKKEAPNMNLDNLKDIEKLQQLVTQAKRVSIWDQVALPKEVREYSRYQWILWNDGSYRISPEKYRTFILQENTLGKWEAILEETHAITEGGVHKLQAPKHTLLGAESELGMLFQRADRYLEKNYPDTMHYHQQTAAWHSGAASEKQFNFLRKQKYPVRIHDSGYQINDGQGGWVLLTKGLASKLITQSINKFKQ